MEKITATDARSFLVAKFKATKILREQNQGTISIWYDKSLLAWRAYQWGMFSRWYKTDVGKAHQTCVMNRIRND